MIGHKHLRVGYFPKYFKRDEFSESNKLFSVRLHKIPTEGPFLNDIGDNANNVNNGNPKSPMSFKYRYFVHSIFPLSFKNDYFNNSKSMLSFKYDTHFSDVI